MYIAVQYIAIQLLNQLKPMIMALCLQALNKKEHKGTDSPEVDQEQQQFVLTPRTEEKYEKINAEFNLMMQRNQVNNRVSPQVHIDVLYLAATSHRSCFTTWATQNRHSFPSYI